MTGRRRNDMRGCGVIAASIMVVLLAAGALGLLGLQSGLISPPEFNVTLGRVALLGSGNITPCSWDRSISQCGKPFYAVNLVVERQQRLQSYSLIRVPLKDGSVPPPSYP